MMLGLQLYEATLCGGCGLPPSVINDPQNNVLQIDTPVCPTCRTLTQFGRVQADQDQKAWDARGEKAPPASPHPSDGRRTVLRKLTPLEAAARRPPQAQPPEPPRPARAGGVRRPASHT